MFSERDKNAARMIVSIFETSKKQGNPAAIAVLDDGAGISYGLHQATHKSGSLEKVLRAFAALNTTHQVSATKFADQFADRTSNNISAMARSAAVKDWLKRAGETPEMKRAQELVFDLNYMQPAIDVCVRCGFIQPLSLAVVYDSHIQGGWAKTREATNEQHTGAVGEQVWIRDYLTQRKIYLSTRQSQAARNSVYRPEIFLTLIKAGNWALTAPFTIKGITVQESDLL